MELSFKSLDHHQYYRRTPFVIELVDFLPKRGTTTDSFEMRTACESNAHKKTFQSRLLLRRQHRR